MKAHGCDARPRDSGAGRTGPLLKLNPGPGAHHVASPRHGIIEVGTRRAQVSPKTGSAESQSPFYWAPRANVTSRREGLERQRLRYLKRFSFENARRNRVEFSPAGAHPRIAPAANGATPASIFGDVNGLSQEVIGALSVAVYMTDAEGRLTFYNKAAVALWGFCPSSASASSVVLGSFTGPMAQRCRTTSARWRWCCSRSDRSPAWRCRPNVRTGRAFPSSPIPHRYSTLPEE